MLAGTLTMETLLQLAPLLAGAMLTSPPALAGDEDNNDEEEDEEEQCGQDVAQLLDEVCPALGDDDIYHVMALDDVGV